MQNLPWCGCVAFTSCVGFHQPLGVTATSLLQAGRAGGRLGGAEGRLSVCIRSMAWQPLGSVPSALAAAATIDLMIAFILRKHHCPQAMSHAHRFHSTSWLAAMLWRFAAPWDAACSSHCMVNARWTALSHEHWLPLPLPACLTDCLSSPLTRPVQAAHGAGC